METQIEKNNSIYEIFFIELVGGTIGGGTSVIFGHPLDTIRVRMQDSSQNLSMFTYLKRAVQKEGFLSLFRGMSSPLIGVPIFNSINFGTYGLFKEIIGITDIHVDKDHEQRLDELQYEMSNELLYKQFICGCMAGFVQTFVSSPIELCKLAMQIDTTSTTRHLTLKTDQGSLGIAKYIYKNYGLKGFKRGLGVTLWRETPGYGLYFVAYEYVKNLVQRKFSTSKNIGNIDIISGLIGGSAAGVAGWLSTYPCDVIKSRMQMDFEGHKYKNTLDCFRKSLKEHNGNYMFLFKGFKTTLIRAIPVNGIQFFGYEMTVKQMYKFKNKYY